MKPLPLNERRRLFLAQQEATRRTKEALPAPPTGPPAPASPRRTWVIATIAAGVIAGGGLLLNELVSFEVPRSLLDAVWPRL